MVKNPEIGGQYWFVTDIWERFCPVPVTIVAVNEEYGALLIRWDIGESEYFEQYEGVLAERAIRNTGRRGGRMPKKKRIAVWICGKGGELS